MLVCSQDDDERNEFVRAVPDFGHNGETDVDYGLLMKWGASGLPECECFAITSKGTEVFDTGLQSPSRETR